MANRRGNTGNPRQVVRGTAATPYGAGGPSAAAAARAVSAAAAAGPTSDVSGKTAILFDFDGTLGDTETPAMEVAFWELAPYFTEASAEYLSTETMQTYVRNNAGKAFEFMVDVVEEDRKAAGLPPIEDVRKSGGEDAAVTAHVDERRKKFGLPPLADTRALNVDILTLQKDETVDALSVLAQPCAQVPEVLETLKGMGVDFSIATTSGKPRVPVSVLSCGFQEYFPPEKIHSGESDFDPPRFKPDPSVYLLAAEKTNAKPENCIAVEDSTSGVGSAANAGLGMIVGYVGGSHISQEMEDGHAGTLMAGGRSENGRGADIVIRDMKDLVRLTHFFKTEVVTGDNPPGSEGATPIMFPRKSLLNGMTDKFWVNDDRVSD